MCKITTELVNGASCCIVEGHHGLKIRFDKVMPEHFLWDKSLEAVIEDNKEGYYRALRQTQMTLKGENPYYEPWLMFFLKSLQKQKSRLAYDLHIHNDFDFIHASLDGELLEIETCKKGIFECKTTEIRRSTDWAKWDKKIPMNYFCQVLHYMAIDPDYKFSVDFFVGNFKLPLYIIIGS